MTLCMQNLLKKLLPASYLHPYHIFFQYFCAWHICLSIAKMLYTLYSKAFFDFNGETFHQPRNLRSCPGGGKTCLYIHLVGGKALFSFINLKTTDPLEFSLQLLYIKAVWLPVNDLFCLFHITIICALKTS